MPAPAFTREEEYLISLLRGDIQESSAFMWSYLLPGLALAGFAAVYDSVWMVLSAFVVVCGFRVYEESFAKKWKPTYRSIILKYEEAIAAGGQGGQIAN
jgi:hypothetical protein